MSKLPIVEKARFFIWNNSDPQQYEIEEPEPSNCLNCKVQINPSSINVGSARKPSGMIGPELPYGDSRGRQGFTGTGPAANQPQAQQPMMALVQNIYMNLIFDVADLYYSMKIGASKDSLSSALLDPLLGKLYNAVGQIEVGNEKKPLSETAVGEFFGLTSVTSPAEVNIYNTNLCCYSHLRDAMERQSVVKFSWGSLEPFVGIITSFNTDLDYFSPEGAPLRANVSLGMDRYFLSQESPGVDRNIVPR